MKREKRKKKSKKKKGKKGKHPSTTKRKKAEEKKTNLEEKEGGEEENDDNSNSKEEERKEDDPKSLPSKLTRLDIKTFKLSFGLLNNELFFDELDSTLFVTFVAILNYAWGMIVRNILPSSFAASYVNYAEILALTSLLLISLTLLRTMAITLQASMDGRVGVVIAILTFIFSMLTLHSSSDFTSQLPWLNDVEEAEGGGSVVIFDIDSSLNNWSLASQNPSISYFIVSLLLSILIAGISVSAFQFGYVSASIQYPILNQIFFFIDLLLLPIILITSYIPSLLFFLPPTWILDGDLVVVRRVACLVLPFLHILFLLTPYLQHFMEGVIHEVSLGVQRKDMPSLQTIQSLFKVF